jgi:hypothetical protein
MPAILVIPEVEIRRPPLAKVLDTLSQPIIGSGSCLSSQLLGKSK